MTRKNKESKLEEKTRVLKFNPIILDGERFIPYCNFEFHQGISKTYEICERRSCKHYKRLYI